jgi:hypothetical protein
MRLSFATVVAACLCTSLAVAAPPAKRPKAATKSKVAQPDPLPTSKADAAVAGRALLVKELPKGITPADRRALDAVVAELRADHLEASVALFHGWAAGSPKPLLREEAVSTALWVFREGVLSRNEELASAADRVRFLDERNAAIDDSLALLKGAVITRKQVLVAKLVVVTAYVREARGDEKRERQVTRDALEAEIRDLEAKGEEIKKERDAARATFRELEVKSGQYMQLLSALVSHANAMRLTAPKH